MYFISKNSVCILLSFFLVMAAYPHDTQAISFTNNADKKLIVKVYAGKKKCYATPPLKPTAYINNETKPTKCDTSLLKIKVYDIKRKLKCIAKNIEWSTDLVLEKKKGKISCGKSVVKEGGSGH